MGNKVNPISFRLQVHKNWDSRWFASKKDFC
jgi:small subunit ribosomal protein S3